MAEAVLGYLVARLTVPWHHPGMNNNATHPYTLEIQPCSKPAGHFEWAIRRHGKPIERSDRPHLTERSARERGEGALERQFRAER